MTVDALSGVLAIPAFAAALLAVLPGYRATARINVMATALTFLCALSLFFHRPQSGAYLLIDDLNATFIVFGIFVFRIRERFDTVDVRALDRFRGGRRDVS